MLRQLAAVSVVLQYVLGHEVGAGPFGVVQAQQDDLVAGAGCSGQVKGSRSEDEGSRTRVERSGLPQRPSNFVCFRLLLAFSFALSFACSMAVWWGGGLGASDTSVSFGLSPLDFALC